MPRKKDPLKNDEEKSSGLFSFEKQIQQLNQTLEALRRQLKDSEERFHSIFENAPIALFTFDKFGKINMWNNALQDLLQLTGQGIGGNTVFKIMAKEDQYQRIHGMIQNIFEGEGLTDIRWEIFPESAHPRYLSISMFPVWETFKMVVFGMAIVVDITEKKHLEQALLQTEKMAALGTLASGLAHEVGTPMNVILGRAESLLKYTQEERTSRGLNIIIEQINRMTKLIQNLLTFAQRKPPERREVHINQVIKKGVEIVEQQTQAKGIAVISKLNQELPPIWGDSDQLLQVFFNLFMNAIDAIEKDGALRIYTDIVLGERRKKIRLDSQSTVNRMIEILVQDTGCGIDQAALYKIFDPFYTTKPTGKGTGLGLAVADGIIRDHGGEIRAKSVIGKGTTFRILLPIG